MSAAQCSHGLVLLLVGMQLASAAFVPGAEVSVLYATDAACTEYDITTFPDGTYAVFFILEDSYFTMQGYEKNGTLSWKKLSPYAGTGSVPVLLDSIHYTPLISSGASAVLGAAVIMVPAREPMTYILATLPVTTRQQWPSGAYTTHYSSASVSSTTELYASVSVVGVPENATFYIAYAMGAATTLYYKQAPDREATSLEAQTPMEYELGPSLTGGFRLAELAYTMGEIRVAFAANEGFAVGMLVPPAEPVLKAEGYVTNPEVVCMATEKSCLYIFETNTSGTFDIVGLVDDALTGWSELFVIANTTSMNPVSPRVDVSKSNDSSATFLVFWNNDDQTTSLRLREVVAVAPTIAPSTNSPPTSAPPTNAPSTNTPSTNAPPTNSPPTNAPATNAPSTNAPPTNSPPTNVPATNAPPTNAPSTNAPPTNVPSTNAPSTNAPPTNAPSTNAPPTNVPSTNAPPTNSPPTNAPATNAPPTIAPDTNAPHTPSPLSSPVRQLTSRQGMGAVSICSLTIMGSAALVAASIVLVMFVKRTPENNTAKC